MKRVLELSREDGSETNVFPCKRLRQLQSALGQRYEKRFVPSYPFDAALESDTDSNDLAHASPGDTAGGLPVGWTTDVASAGSELSSFVQAPLLRTVTSRLLPARWEDSDADSDLDSEPDAERDADMVLESSPSASPSPTTPSVHGEHFSFIFPSQRGRAHTVQKSQPASGVRTVSCAHPVLCCAMCGLRMVRMMSEMGVQAQEQVQEARITPANSVPLRTFDYSKPPEIGVESADESEDMDLEEDEPMDLPVPPTALPAVAPSTNSTKATGTPAASHPKQPEPRETDATSRVVSNTHPTDAPATILDNGKNPGASTSSVVERQYKASLSVPTRPAPQAPRAMTALPFPGRPIPTGPAALSGTAATAAMFSTIADAARPQPPSTQPPPLPPSASGSGSEAPQPPEPAALPPPLPVQRLPGPRWAGLVSSTSSLNSWPTQPTAALSSPPPPPSFAVTAGATSSTRTALFTLPQRPMFPGLGFGAGQGVTGVHMPSASTTLSPPEPAHPPPPLPTLPPPPSPPPSTSRGSSLTIAVASPSTAQPPSGGTEPAAPGSPACSDVAQKLLALVERRRRKREKRKQVKKEVREGTRPKPTLNLPLRREGQEYQCPVDCRWFTLVGFLGHFDMKHEGRCTMSRRLRDELVRQCDRAEFWKHFWAHCDLRPDEYHSHYVRVDYGRPPEDMEDGEIAEIAEIEQSGSRASTATAETY